MAEFRTAGQTKDKPFCLDDPVAQERTKNSGNRCLQVAGHHAFITQIDEDSHRIGIVTVACLLNAGNVLTISYVWHTRVKFHALDKTRKMLFSAIRLTLAHAKRFYSSCENELFDRMKRYGKKSKR